MTEDKIFWKISVFNLGVSFSDGHCFGEQNWGEALVIETLFLVETSWESPTSTKPSHTERQGLWKKRLFSKSCSVFLAEFKRLFEDFS